MVPSPILAIIEVPYVIQDETEGVKNKVVKPYGAKMYLFPFKITYFKIIILGITLLTLKMSHLF